MANWAATLNFGDWMGISGNALDFDYNSFDQIPRILTEFCNLCIEAANADPKFCPLASASMKSSDPASDLVGRINNIISSLSTTAGYVDPHGSQNITLGALLGLVINTFMNPSGMPAFAQFLLDAETSIQTGKTISKRSISDLSYSNQPLNDPLAGFFNPFTNDARSCVDNSFAGIDNPNDFLDYLSTQIADNPLVAFSGVGSAECLTWPNFTSYDVERFTGPFPSKLKNKLLVIGITGDPIASITGAMSTYQYIGEDNAVFLIHDAYGFGTIVQPNDCTTAAIKAYLTNGYTLFAIAYLRNSSRERYHLSHGKYGIE